MKSGKAPGRCEAFFLDQKTVKHGQGNAVSEPIKNDAGKHGSVPGYSMDKRAGARAHKGATSLIPRSKRPKRPSSGM